MSSTQTRQQLERKRAQRVDAEKRVGRARIKESRKRADADKARQAAAKSKSSATVRSKMNEADRRDKEAATAGKEANQWQERASRYSKEEQTLQARLSRAEASERDAAERKSRREQRQAARQAGRDREALETRMSTQEVTVAEALRTIREPKEEKLRVLLLGASSNGGLRIGREQKRIRNAVQSALHRDLIELDVRPAATTDDLLDGITRFRPHVIHFSGHSTPEMLEFEHDVDCAHERGQDVPANTFARAIKATDDPPLLVLLNSCDSAAQIDDLVETAVPFAIGMSGQIGDEDAIVFATRLYASIANGQSLKSAHASGKLAVELAGLEGYELPTLAAADGFDPAQAILVRPAR